VRGLEFLPSLGFTLYGGWILLVFYIFIIGGIMMSMPKDVIARLYDTSHWTKKQHNRSKVAKLFLLLGYGSASLMPLNLDTIEFKAGVTLYVIGLTLFYSALKSYSKTPHNEPVTKGLYSISRNPQQVSQFFVFIGIGIAVGSWLVLGVTIVGIFLSHLRILAEEEQCLIQYGNSYREYMENTPRYFLIF
jgi:protein-S-isoprenylcysteine O-methyltransferase Ste14